MGMWAKWDGRKIVVGPQEKPMHDKDTAAIKPGWFPVDDSAQRTSPAQTQRVYLEDGIIVIDYEGDPDPAQAPVSKAELKATWLSLMEAPVRSASGHWFDFDQTSERLMAGTIRALASTGGMEQWRLADNTELSVSYEELRDYFEELSDARALRGLNLNQDYLNYKQDGCTRAELEAWKATYALPE